MGSPYREAPPRPWTELREYNGHLFMEREVRDGLAWRRRWFCLWCGREGVPVTAEGRDEASGKPVPPLPGCPGPV